MAVRIGMILVIWREAIRRKGHWTPAKTKWYRKAVCRMRRKRAIRIARWPICMGILEWAGIRETLMYPWMAPLFRAQIKTGRNIPLPSTPMTTINRLPTINTTSRLPMVWGSPSCQFLMILFAREQWSPSGCAQSTFAAARTTSLSRFWLPKTQRSRCRIAGQNSVEPRSSRLPTLLSLCRKVTWLTLLGKRRSRGVCRRWLRRVRWRRALRCSRFMKTITICCSLTGKRPRWTMSISWMTCTSRCNARWKWRKRVQSATINKRTSTNSTPQWTRPLK